MRPQHLLLRCYARQQGGVWVAVCIDLSLAAQADTYNEARHKLDAQIREYVEDGLVGRDRESARMLLSRKSPLSQRITYHMIGLTDFLRSICRSASRDSGQPTKFDAPLPLVPAPC
ncbi:DUF1902 domain-containing protein [Silanimonas sp.]|uniref:DUF1902 domain-containing protein n=1 Tax=Silanimonas sp. TaxID=1929290 RepID=UPI001BBD3520|nr:DUF1902 domain-containing protein [Silanimonas sp.]MBS3896323.1 DUF1902 domain-containing protein [Silanimonas sp.]